jgi:ATP-binding protein involved in chromosome partitioning
MTDDPTPLSERILQALAQVQDPELHQDLVSLGMIQDLDASEQRVRVKVMLTTPACPLKDVIGRDVRAAIAGVTPDAEIVVDFGADVRDGKRKGTPDEEGPLLPGVKNVILVSSAKGGVGKSTVAANLAVALAKLGASVGLLDADILGPSMPIMFGVEGNPLEPNEDGKTFDPVEKHGVKLVSMGFLLPPGQAIIWRGPMQSSAIVQFTRECQWGELDYLVVDLPPGTGDIQLTVAQKLAVTGAVMVSTPQDVALADVVRGQAMFDKVDVPVIGVIENMSYFLCDGCGKRHELFGSGGAQRTAERLDLEFLGALPLEQTVRRTGDAGVPQVLAYPDAELTATFMDIARRVAARVSVLAHVRQAAADDH